MKMLLIASSVALVACGSSAENATGPICTDVGVPAIALAVLDGRTNQPIATNAVVVVREGVYADTARALGSPARYLGAFNRPGTYTVSVEVQGYRAWEISGVTVARGLYNVTTLPLAAWLTVTP